MRDKEKYGVSTDTIRAREDAYYWRKRCLLAERCLDESPCDHGVPEGLIEAHRAYAEFIMEEGRKK